MRVRTYALGSIAALGVTMGWFAGCGGNVSEATSGTTSGSGGGGTTGSVTTVTSSVSTTSSTSSTSSSSSSSSSGSTPCDMACAHVSMCTGGQYTCASANIDCTTVGSQFDCAAECLNALSCTQLAAQAMSCFSATCSDGGAADGGAPVDAGMSGAACAQCLGTGTCQQAAVACGLDKASGCQSWFLCAAGCYGQTPIDPTCLDNCDAQYPNAVAEYDAVYACTCANCITQCGTDACSHVADAGDGG